MSALLSDSLSDSPSDSLSERLVQPLVRTLSSDAQFSRCVSKWADAYESVAEK